MDGNAHLHIWLSLDGKLDVVGTDWLTLDGGDEMYRGNY